tara:strand:+ start:931 stop:2934 length:2004 start_codon:yes stop_codon:yes gene_type:complete
MSGIKDQDRIQALRKRLYERGRAAEPASKHTLSDTEHEVARSWSDKPRQQIDAVKKIAQKQVQRTAAQYTAQDTSTTVEAVQNTATQETSMAPRKKKRGYRFKLLLAGVLFFVLAMGISSTLLIIGKPTISGENITLAVTAPFTIGGGEVLPVQVGITNDNTVPIESATLIVEYPLGTQSASEERNELFVERLTLDTVTSGQTVNVPLRAVVFGEENDEKEIKVSIEYRVSGSNATFFKEADPLRFKINSSPIIVRADALKKVSSGQETEVELTITSNAQNALSQVLVKAEYPLGFDFTKASPEPNSAQNIWIIKNLEPEESKTITVTGIVIGKETDEYVINFTVGVPNERDPFSLASVFATTQTAFEIEQPFLDIALEIGGVANGEVIIEPGQQSGAAIDIKNTLDDTLYDIEVEVQLGGNALSDLDVGPPNGFYDSLNNKIVWDATNAPDLRELYPGRKTRLAFGIEPSSTVKETPQITLNVNVKARRVSESQVAEMLLGTAQSVIKVSTEPVVRSDIGYNSGIFSDRGPVPPKAEQKTTYTVSFMAENGTNNMGDTTVTATLPPYVTWLDTTSGAGTMTFDPIQRQVTWDAGDVEANAAAFGSFQVEILPSKTQIGTTPVLVNEQRLKATDLFTGTVVRAVNAAITTEMSTETGQPKENGRVVE